VVRHHARVARGHRAHLEPKCTAIDQQKQAQRRSVTLSVADRQASGRLAAPARTEDRTPIDNGANWPSNDSYHGTQSEFCRDVDCVCRSCRRAAGRDHRERDELSQLLELAQRGGAREREVLLGAIRPGVLAFLRRSVSAAHAEDLTQQVLLRVNRRYQAILPIHATAYLLTIARNVLRTALRRQAARNLVNELIGSSPGSTALAGADDSHAILELRELADAIIGACDALPSITLRSVARGILIDDRDQGQLAAELGISQVTLRKRLSRAREYLRVDAKLLLLVRDMRARPRRSRASGVSRAVGPITSDRRDANIGERSREADRGGEGASH
jgi:RNA polymerase sigma factor (sigma-70 family)